MVRTPLVIHESVLGWVLLPIMIGVVLAYFWLIASFLRDPSRFPALRSSARKPDRGFSELDEPFGLTGRRPDDWLSRQWEANQDEEEQRGLFLSRTRDTPPS